MTNQQKIICLENLVLQEGDQHQLLHLQNRATELRLSDTEYLDYLSCYLRKVIQC